MSTDDTPEGNTPSAAPPAAEPARDSGNENNRGGARWWLYVIGLGVAGAAGYGAWTMRDLRRHRVQHEAREQAGAQNAPIAVSVMRVRLAPALREVTLPGDVRAFQQTSVYAKVSGYVRQLRVDRGDRVTRGQVLGVIEAPEADAQVRAAQTEAALRARLAERAQTLSARGIVSQQDNEVASAQLAEARSGLHRAQSQQRYEYIRAPFDGVVTARYADLGALLPAATGSTQSALPLVDVADIDRVRVLVYFGQDVASEIREGTPVTLRSGPGHEIPATVTRVAGALDARTRTMAGEIHLDNRSRSLLPGSFVRVTVRVPGEAAPLVPSEALFFRGDRMLVATVTDGVLHFVPVETGVDDGRTVQVVRGLRGGETVAVNLPLELGDGARVRAVERPAPAGSTPGGGNAGSPGNNTQGDAGAPGRDAGTR